MENPFRLFLRASLAVAGLLVACPRPAGAYIKVEPLTLGNLSRQSMHIYVLRVEKVHAEKGVILFQFVAQLKGKPDGTPLRHAIRPNVKGAKVILDWAAEGKTAVMFTCTSESRKNPHKPKAKGEKVNLGGRGHAYIDGYWYWLTYNSQNSCWLAGAGEPAWLSQYCGTAEKLRDALARILRGQEVVVPCMAKDNKEDLLQRRAKVQRLRASLKILNYDPRRNFVGWGAKAVHGADGKNALPDPARTVLEKAQRIEVLSLGVSRERSKHDYHGRTVLGRTTVRDADTRRRVMAALNKGIEEYDGTAAEGFKPRHGIRARYDGKTVDLVICFECLSMQVFTRHEKGNVLTKDSVLTTASPAAIFDEVLKDATVPLGAKPQRK